MTRETAPNALLLPAFLEGDTVAHGVFEDRFGKLRRQFRVAIRGYWDGDEFVLDEDFAYADGATETRQWRLRIAEDGRFAARCADSIDDATGLMTADTAEFRYRIALDIGGRKVAVRFHDRLYRVDDALVMNRATVSKWGIRLGEVSLVFTRPPIAAA